MILLGLALILFGVAMLWAGIGSDVAEPSPSVLRLGLGLVAIGTVVSVTAIGLAVARAHDAPYHKGEALGVDHPVPSSRPVRAGVADSTANDNQQPACQECTQEDHSGNDTSRYFDLFLLKNGHGNAI